MSFYRNILSIFGIFLFALPLFAETVNPPEKNAKSELVLAAKIKLNQATVKEFMKIKGISATKARAIVAYRKKHQQFASVGELAKVKGFKKMKPERLKQIEEQIAVN